MLRKRMTSTKLHKGIIAPKGQKRLNTAGVQPFLSSGSCIVCDIVFNMNWVHQPHPELPA